MSTYDELLKLNKPEQPPSPKLSEKTTSKDQFSTQKATSKTTQNPPRLRTRSSDIPRNKPRKSTSSDSLNLPTRDEVQEFSFRLRDELKAKVQAEVPHQWTQELEDVARQLNVRKLELYRFILGEFLGKVDRNKPA